MSIQGKKIVFTGTMSKTRDEMKEEELVGLMPQVLSVNKPTFWFVEKESLKGKKTVQTSLKLEYNH